MEYRYYTVQTRIRPSQLQFNGSDPDKIKCRSQSLYPTVRVNFKMSTQLELAVQELISLICDIKTMEQSVVEMEYDTKKAPLGKITTEQVIFIQIGRSLTGYWYLAYSASSALFICF